jgi:hypothetical protein
MMGRAMVMTASPLTSTVPVDLTYYVPWPHLRYCRGTKEALGFAPCTQYTVHSTFPGDSGTSGRSGEELGVEGRGSSPWFIPEQPCCLNSPTFEPVAAFDSCPDPRETVRVPFDEHVAGSKGTRGSRNATRESRFRSPAGGKAK